MDNIKEKIKAALLKSGVKNLIEFGYPDVTVENILIDPVYWAFFKEMLEELVEGHAETSAAIVAQEILTQKANEHTRNLGD